jgi:glutathione peroxidase
VSAALYDAPVTVLGGGPGDLRDYADHVVLIVNTASQCGLTPQYAGLQRLQDRFAGRGFTVLAFPCNQFGGRSRAVPTTSGRSAATGTA